MWAELMMLTDGHVRTRLVSDPTTVSPWTRAAALSEGTAPYRTRDPTLRISYGGRLEQAHRHVAAPSGSATSIRGYLTMTVKT